MGEDEDRCPDCGFLSYICYRDDAIWCDRYQGAGSVDCHCGGDLCFCENGGEMDCPRCHGEGEFVPKPGQLEREAEQHRKLREIMAAAIKGETQNG